MKICSCGSAIEKDQHCVETPVQFAKRYDSGYCRAKCKRIYAPVKQERTRPTLEGGGFNYSRPEGVAQEKDLTPRDEAFREFTRTFDCCDCGWPAHMGYMENHHIRTGGTSIKCSDYESVNLCGIEARGCHAKADKSPGSYEKYLPIALMLQTLWIQAGHKLKK